MAFMRSISNPYMASLPPPERVEMRNSTAGARELAARTVLIWSFVTSMVKISIGEPSERKFNDVILDFTVLYILY